MTDRPRLAATTILLRESVGKGALPEVLLIRRPAQMRTFSDMWVFPGGHVDAADSDKVAPWCATLEDRTRLAQIAEASNASKEDEGSSAVGLAVAACRELFEEAGI